MNTNSRSRGENPVNPGRCPYIRATGKQCGSLRSKTPDGLCGVHTPEALEEAEKEIIREATTRLTKQLFDRENAARSSAATKQFWEEEQARDRAREAHAKLVTAELEAEEFEVNRAAVALMAKAKELLMNDGCSQLDIERAREAVSAAKEIRLAKLSEGRTDDGWEPRG